MKISSIVAMGKNRVIGKDNKLMWKIPSETKHYRGRLGNHYFLIGRKNYESSQGRLDNDKALILTRNIDYNCDGHVFNDIEAAIQFAKDKGEKELFVLGGEKIYESLMPHINTLYLSIVEFEEDGDTYFPSHEQYDWSVEDSFRREIDSETPIPWSYQKLVKIKK